MANIAIFASGNGSNFEAIANRIKDTTHSIEFLLCNRRGAKVIERAKRLGIPIYTIDYRGRERKEVEIEMEGLLARHKIDLIVLAGWMKVLTEYLVNRYKNRIVNIHPALLPKYPGTEAIERSYRSKDRELGITIHLVDTGVDTGPILFQKSFKRNGHESLEDIERYIHRLEHLYYPEAIMELLENREIKHGAAHE